MTVLRLDRVKKYVSISRRLYSQYRPYTSRLHTEWITPKISSRRLTRFVSLLLKGVLDTFLVFFPHLFSVFHITSPKIANLSSKCLLSHYILRHPLYRIIYGWSITLCLRSFCFYVKVTRILVFAFFLQKIIKCINFIRVPFKFLVFVPDSSVCVTGPM